MMPPTSIDGTDITGATIDGTDVQEITVDGQTVFTAVPPLPASTVHQYDATLITASDGDPVSAWADNVSSDDLTAGTAPTYKQTIINGQPVVRFDGSNDLLDVDWPDINEPYEFFLVFQLNSTGGFDVILDGFNNQVEFYSSTVPNFRIRQSSNVVGSSSDTNAHIANIIFRAGSSNDILNLDGSLDASGDSGNTISDGLTVGARNDGSFHSEVDIGEIVVYNTELSSSDRSSEETRLSDKWGITI
jgi:hypothetical protein